MDQIYDFPNNYQDVGSSSVKSHHTKNEKEDNYYSILNFKTQNSLEKKQLYFTKAHLKIFIPVAILITILLLGGIILGSLVIAGNMIKVFLLNKVKKF